MESLAWPFWLLIFVAIVIRTSISLDIIGPGHSLKDGETLASAGGTFEFGFFSPPYARSRYLGIWYKNITPQTVVWVANREQPLRDTSGAVNLTSRGVLVIVANGGSSIYWSSSMTRILQDPVAQLLDSGNLVVRERNDENPDRYLWQGFDYPCDTWLPGMKLGKNLHTGLDLYLSSWKSPEDPAPGEFSTRIDARGYPQVVFRRGYDIIYRAGSWNGITWTGTPYMLPGPSYKQQFQLNDKEVSMKFEVGHSLALTRYSMASSGFVQRYIWNDRSRNWVVVATAKADLCESYALCGAYGSCNFSNSPICLCLDGFIPKSPSEWNSSNWSGGCTRKTGLDCHGKDGFAKHSGKLPDTTNSSWLQGDVNLKQCEEMCLTNCSCTAYSSLDVKGIGCLFWYGDLFDIRTFPEGGQDMYVRLAAAELGEFAWSLTSPCKANNIEKRKSTAKKEQAGIISGSVVLAAIVLVVAGIYISLRRKKNRKFGIVGIEEDIETPILDLVAIADATNNFSSGNKLGEGGFGPVYKVREKHILEPEHKLFMVHMPEQVMKRMVVQGTMLDGQEIAVKRLSKRKIQGLDEFKTEVNLIAKLQHRNLVKLLGCGISEDEKILVYEYLPNKSLDTFIFDRTKCELLDWPKRMNIIQGIGRGILYLHQDSRLRIIHRDLKASNILLDTDLNPKISDFGIARLFGQDETQQKTKRVIGTFGYMAPEYAMNGVFSTKSDVFSFGVLVLEMVTGKRNRGFHHPDNNLNLLGHTWMLWNEGTQLQLVDECLFESCKCYSSQITRCINVALLCVQQRPQDRPTMSTAVLMLGSENSLPQPKQPGFFTGTIPSQVRRSPSNNASNLSNPVTMTLEPR